VRILEKLKDTSHQFSRYPAGAFRDLDPVGLLYEYASEGPDAPVLRSLLGTIFYIIVRSPESLAAFVALAPVDMLEFLFNNHDPLLRRLAYLFIHQFCSQAPGRRLIAEAEPIGVAAIVARTSAMLQEVGASAFGLEHARRLVHLLVAIVEKFDDEFVAPHVAAMIDIARATLDHPDLFQRAVDLLVRLAFAHHADVVDGGLFAEVMADAPIVQQDYIVEVLQLAAQVLYVDSTPTTFEAIPVEFFCRLFVRSLDGGCANREAVVSNLLTVFTNILSRNADAVTVLATPEYLNALYFYAAEGPSQAIRSGTIWLLWTMIKFFRIEHQGQILAFRPKEGDDELLEIMMDGFHSDSLTFIQKALLPSVLEFVQKLQREGRTEEPPFNVVLPRIQEALKELCYREDSKEIQSWAASVLKICFRSVFDAQKFV
jgi:hypothetical protein